MDSENKRKEGYSMFFMLLYFFIFVIFDIKADFEKYKELDFWIMDVFTTILSVSFVYKTLSIFKIKNLELKFIISFLVSSLLDSVEVNGVRINLSPINIVLLIIGAIFAIVQTVLMYYLDKKRNIPNQKRYLIIYYTSLLCLLAICSYFSILIL